MQAAVQAPRLGASDYLTKPLDIGRLKSILANVASVQQPQAAPAPPAPGGGQGAAPRGRGAPPPGGGGVPPRRPAAAAPARGEAQESDRLGLLLGASPPMQAVYE